MLSLLGESIEKPPPQLTESVSEAQIARSRGVCCDRHWDRSSHLSVCNSHSGSRFYKPYLVHVFRLNRIPVFFCDKNVLESPEFEADMDTTRGFASYTHSRVQNCPEPGQPIP
jgi:hypothetical protein